MTSEQLWKRLNNIANKKQTSKTTMEFVKTLVQGYCEELEILILGVKDARDPDKVNQLCLMNDEGKKEMIYFTSKKHGETCNMKLPIGSTYLSECMSVNLCDVINNAIEKPEIDYIIFNPGSNNSYVIPVPMLIIAIMRYGHIPLF